MPSENGILMMAMVRRPTKQTCPTLVKMSVVIRFTTGENMSDM